MLGFMFLEVWFLSVDNLSYFPYFCSIQHCECSLELLRGGYNRYLVYVFWAKIRRIIFTLTNLQFNYVNLGLPVCLQHWLVKVMVRYAKLRILRSLVRTANALIRLRGITGFSHWLSHIMNAVRGQFSFSLPFRHYCSHIAIIIQWRC